SVTLKKGSATRWHPLHRHDRKIKATSDLGSGRGDFYRRTWPEKPAKLGRFSVKDVDMLPEMTPAVSRAIEAAQRWASRFAADAVSRVHLLCGLLEEEEGRAATLLVQVGLDLAALQQDLRAGASSEASASEAELGSAARQVLTEARDVARSL